MFCRFSIPLFNKLQNMNNFKVPTIQSLLKQTFDNLDGDSAALGHPEWWLSGSGDAGGLNASAIGKVNQELAKALHKIHGTTETQL